MNIKKFVLIAAVAVLALASSPIRAAQDKNLDFKLVNKTGLTIDKLFVGPSSSENWGPDILGRDVLNDGETAEIKFSTGQSECNWDLKIVDEKGGSVSWIGLDLCKAEEITLMYQDKKATAIIK